MDPDESYSSSRDDSDSTRARQLSNSSSPTSPLSLSALNSSAVLRLSTALLSNRSVMFDALLAVVRTLELPAVEAALGDVMAVLHRRGSFVRFAKFCLRQEIAACQQKTTLFRAGSVFVSIMSLLYKDPASRAFLQAIVQPVCDSLVQHGVKLTARASSSFVNSSDEPPFLEIDPAKWNGSMELAAQSLSILQLHASMLVQSVRLGAHLFPPTLRHFLVALHDEVKVHFPGSEWPVYSSMIFLRFIVPNLIMPPNAEKLPPGAQKSLVRLAKLMQALANGVKFGDDDMECVFNAWLGKQDPMGAEYFAKYLDQQDMRLGEQGDVLTSKLKKQRSGFLSSKKRGDDKNELRLSTCKSVAASKRIFLAALEANEETKGKFVWMEEVLDELTNTVEK